MHYHVNNTECISDFQIYKNLCYSGTMMQTLLLPLLIGLMARISTEIRLRFLLLSEIMLGNKKEVQNEEGLEVNLEKFE